MFYSMANNPQRVNTVKLFGGEVLRYTQKIDCRANNFLRCEPVKGATVEARAVGTSGWSNLETVPIELSAWDGERRAFEFQVTIENVAEQQAFKVRFFVSV